ncbi:MAG: CHAT domain-containing protein, partial [Gammaproteobacteria bacterium]|nr:CHAT domain-containing protein [Gammaproteobacteria bacterium]
KAKVNKELQSGKYDVLHYAGHTAFYPDSPMDTGIICANGVLTGNELTTIRNLPAVVLFNSCESARVGGLTQHGARGLARNVGLAEAFLRGGVANYVGTHWQVADDAAPAFMKAFYGALLNGETMGNAVSGGRQAVKNLGSRDWADYIHYGSPAFVLKVPHGETTR